MYVLLNHVLLKHVCYIEKQCDDGKLDHFPRRANGKN